MERDQFVAHKQNLYSSPPDRKNNTGRSVSCESDSPRNRPADNAQNKLVNRPLAKYDVTVYMKTNSHLTLKASQSQAYLQLSNKFQQKMLFTNTHSNSHLSHSKDCTICRATATTLSTKNNNSLTRVTTTQEAEPTLGVIVQGNLTRRALECTIGYKNCKVISDLIYNEPAHVVSIFKDYLILDDVNEFLKRRYGNHEAVVRLPKLCNFYDQYSQLFPNYVILAESKHMFANIQRKQRLIDEHFRNERPSGKFKKAVAKEPCDEDKMFTSKFIESVLLRHGNTSHLARESDTSCGQKDQEELIRHSVTQFQQNAAKLEMIGSSSTRAQQNQPLEDLIEAFLHRDSEQTIRVNTSAENITDSFLDTQNSQIFGADQPSSLHIMSNDSISMVEAMNGSQNIVSLVNCVVPRKLQKKTNNLELVKVQNLNTQSPAIFTKKGTPELSAAKIQPKYVETESAFKSPASSPNDLSPPPSSSQQKSSQYRQERDNYLDAGLDQETPSKYKPSTDLNLQRLVIKTNLLSAQTSANMVQSTAQKPTINRSGRPLTTQSPLQTMLYNSNSAQQIRHTERQKPKLTQEERPATQVQLPAHHIRNTSSTSYRHQSSKKFLTFRDSLATHLSQNLRRHINKAMKPREEDIPPENDAYGDYQCEYSTQKVPATPSKTDTVSVGTTINENDDRNYVIDSEGAHVVDRQQLCPSSLLPKKRNLFASSLVKGTGGESINKMTVASSNAPSGRNTYFSPSDVVEGRAKTSLQNNARSGRSSATGGYLVKGKADLYTEAQSIYNSGKQLQRQHSDTPSKVMAHSKSPSGMFGQKKSQKTLATYKEYDHLLQRNGSRNGEVDQEKTVQSTQTRKIAAMVRCQTTMDLGMKELRKGRESQTSHSNDLNAYQQHHLNLKTGFQHQKMFSMTRSISKDSQHSHTIEGKKTVDINVKKLSKLIEGTKSLANLRSRVSQNLQQTLNTGLKIRTISSTSSVGIVPSSVKQKPSKNLFGSASMSNLQKARPTELLKTANLQKNTIIHENLGPFSSLKSPKLPSKTARKVVNTNFPKSLNMQTFASQSHKDFKHILKPQQTLIPKNSTGPGLKTTSKKQKPIKHGVLAPKQPNCALQTRLNTETLALKLKTPASFKTLTLSKTSTSGSNQDHAKSQHLNIQCQPFSTTSQTSTKMSARKKPLLSAKLGQFKK